MTEPNALSTSPNAPWWSTSQGVKWFVLCTLGFLLSRFIFIGFHSPWNDEIANWSWAVQLPGGEIEGKHWLTYHTIWLFTRISNSIYFVSFTDENLSFIF